MAEIKHIRIDDRLIHGQIVASWMSVLNADTIVVADDKAAGDAMQTMLLEMAVPPGTTLKIMSIADAAAYLNDAATDTSRLLLILRNVKSALAIWDAGVSFGKINVGNVSSAAGKTKYTKAIWLNAEDEADYRALHGKGVFLEIQVVPNEKATDLMNLLN